jgi:hypothetical protein
VSSRTTLLASTTLAKALVAQRLTATTGGVDGITGRKTSVEAAAA